MTRDYSQFLPSGTEAPGAKRTLSRLEKLGWNPYFAQQTDSQELDETPPARVVEVRRNGLYILGETVDTVIPPEAEATVGDWLLYDQNKPATSMVLTRKSLFKRRAPGSELQVQLIAANVDTAFIVTSCNQDFNVARLERYIALALDADVNPVIILTKPDLCEAPDDYKAKASAISDLVPAIMLDARGVEPQKNLAEWCQPGQTIAFLGSSGVGKSTLTNALLDGGEIETQAIREDDAKGRHTTSHRQLHLTSTGYTILDSPGMRELQLTDNASGVEALFSDLHDLTAHCRFNDCAHETEPGCAITAALEQGEIDRARVARWKKLVAEDRYNSASLAKRKSNDKALGKMIRSIQKGNRK